jgi:hypothetical protein
MRLIKRESIENKSLVPLGFRAGEVTEIEEMKEFAKVLERDQELYLWWRVGMGFVKDGG